MDTVTIPAPVPPGTAEYYRERNSDFLRRHPHAEPPAYYLAHGDRALKQFLHTEPTMTPPGQVWLRETMRLLQAMMEALRVADPAGFDVMERDEERFRDFAFSLHAPAYLAAGVFDLPLDDLLRIVRTPDLSDLLSIDGLLAIRDLVRDTRPYDVAHIVSQTVRRPWRTDA